MKIKKQTRKLAAGCSKHCFEVVDKTDEVSSKYCFEVVDKTDEVSSKHRFEVADRTDEVSSKHRFEVVDKLTWFEEIFKGNVDAVCRDFRDEVSNRTTVRRS
ncbi:chlorohydrolase [Streptococcus pneumoniae]|nr:chlorohydrolase [Streptococcus pneumoniae]